MENGWFSIIIRCSPEGVAENRKRKVYGSGKMTKHVALTTWNGLPNGAASERLLLPHLAAGGVEGQIVIWSDSAIEFGRFDLVVLRSCWDYHVRDAEFIEWLKQTAQVTNIANDLETVLWNRNKAYLAELARLGIEMPATIFANGKSTALMEIGSWEKAVVKPAVSASAHKTWLYTRESLPALHELQQQMNGEAFLIQEYVPEIETLGEISFIYLDGAYSHAVLKRPAAGDFRVQQEHGGSAGAIDPPQDLRQQADAIANAVPYVKRSLYCRLDVVVRNGRLLLMELELIEPELFLGLAPGSAAMMAEAIRKRLA